MPTFTTLTRPFRSTHPACAALALVAALAVASCGSDGEGDTSGDNGAPSADDVSQTVEFTATEYEFGADPDTVIVAGETVRFRVTNVGELDHEMIVLDDTGSEIERTPELAPGTTGELIVTFDEAGAYQLICDIDDHLTRGQQAVFSVNEP